MYLQLPAENEPKEPGFVEMTPEQKKAFIHKVNVRTVIVSYSMYVGICLGLSMSVSMPVCMSLCLSVHRISKT